MQHIERVVSAAIAISCHFRLFRFRYERAFANVFNERPDWSGRVLQRIHSSLDGFEAKGRL
jgi:hypothetical protein